MIASILSTGLIVLVLAVSAGVAIAVIVKIVQNVRKKATEQGVVVSDGVTPHELLVVAKLIKEELEESKDLEALRTLKRVIEKAASAKSL